MRDAALSVDDDDDEALDAAIVLDYTSHRSVTHLIVDADTQDDGLAPVVLLEEMEELEVVSVGDNALGCYTCRKLLCFLCPNPYPFPTGFSENTRVYAPGFGNIAAKMLRINPNSKKKRSGYILWPLGISLGIYPVAAREIAWDFFRRPLGKSLGIFPVGARDIAWDLSGGRLDPPQGFLPTCLTQSVGVFRKVKSDPTH